MISHILFLLRLFFIYLFQVLNNQLQQVINNTSNQRQPSVVIEETIIEDSTFPEQVAQELIIKDDTVTHIGAGPYNGFMQGSWLIEIIYLIGIMKKESAIYTACSP